MQQVADWLEKLGLGQYAERFAENDISFAVLPDLTDQDLKEIGVSLGHRRQLLRAIAELTRRAGDINAVTVSDDASLDELLGKIRDELRKLGPLIDLQAIREPQGSRTEGGSTAGRNIGHGWRSGA